MQKTWTFFGIPTMAKLKPEPSYSNQQFSNNQDVFSPTKLNATKPKEPTRNNCFDEYGINILDISYCGKQ